MAVILISLLLYAVGQARTAVTAAQEPALPLAPPDAEAGLALYNERCALCHGPLGMGDGEQAVAAGLQPRNFTDPAYHLSADPQRMFDVITNGSLASGMPPFGPTSTNPINELDRWNLWAAVYSFGLSPDDLEVGEAVFNELGGDPADIPDLDTWFTTSNEVALAALENGDWGIDVSEMSQAEKVAVVEYGRAQSYIYSNPMILFEPISAASISGLVVNGTSGEELTGGEAVLRGFNSNLEETLVMTTTIGADGRYTFALENVPPENIYLVSTRYEGLTFNGDANRLQRSQPELNMPIIVYDTTTDPGVVTIDQIHMILNFVPDAVQVSELYIFSNEANAVFVGESGDFSLGTVQMSLPAGATDVDFRRAFGSMENFVPAAEVIQTETGWADTLPLRPGTGSSNLMVSYVLPYEDGLQLAHPLAYQTNGATAILPDNGVRLEGDGWVSQGNQALASGSFATYMNNNLAGATALNLELDGRARTMVDAQGNAVLARSNSTQELVIGVTALGLVLAAGVVLVRKWQAPPDLDQEVQQLLLAIAALDDAYQAGTIDEAKYTAERARLKTELLAIWPSVSS